MYPFSSSSIPNLYRLVETKRVAFRLEIANFGVVLMRANTADFRPMLQVCRVADAVVSRHGERFGIGRTIGDFKRDRSIAGDGDVDVFALVCECLPRR